MRIISSRPTCPPKFGRSNLPSYVVESRLLKVSPGQAALKSIVTTVGTVLGAVANAVFRIINKP